MSDEARLLASALEPVTGQVYFSPECHEAYAALGFSPSPASAGAVALPDGPAYFTSRGSCMGQVPGQVVASAFAVFNPAAVVPAVDYGWTLTDAPTIAAARTAGAIAQLVRVRVRSPTASGGRSTCCSGPTSRCAPRAARSTRGCSRSACPATPWATSGGSATCCASTGATPTLRRGSLWRVRRHGDRSADRAVLGSPHPQLRADPGMVGRRPRCGRGAAVEPGPARRGRLERCRVARHRARRRGSRPTSSASRSSTRSGATSTSWSRSSPHGAQRCAPPGGTSRAVRTTSRPRRPGDRGRRRRPHR